MTMVELLLPQEVVEGLTVDGVRDRDVVSWRVAIDGLAVTSSLITISTLQTQLPILAQAIRGWVTGRGTARTTTLHVKGPNVEIRLDLPPNVSTQTITEAINRALEAGP